MHIWCLLISFFLVFVLSEQFQLVKLAHTLLLSLDSLSLLRSVISDPLGHSLIADLDIVSDVSDWSEDLSVIEGSDRFVYFPVNVVL